ncbi:MAG: two-component regulator propeller domain-containing protein [Blastocatellia bacterium]|nr:two-component regulator propeller domain-containing protein [Blastocatellia bacterium]
MAKRRRERKSRAWRGLPARAFPAIGILLFAAAFWGATAQEPGSDPAGEAAARRQERSAESATLNLHRWGAVTMFHGLPSDRVNAIAEDAGGSMWFATDNGLVRYDGKNVEAVPNESALPSRRILALRVDSRGALWIGTEAGAGVLRGNRIELLPETRGQAVTGIASAPGGEMGLVTGRGEILRYPAPASYAPRGSESTEYGASARTESAAAPGPVRIDPTTAPYQLKSPNTPNEALPLTAIAFTGANDWAIGSSGRGLLLHREREVREAVARPPRPYFVASIYSDADRVWIAEQASKQAGGLWTWRNGMLTRAALNAGPVTSVHGGDGEIWAGTTRQGAFLLAVEGAQGNEIRTVEHLTFANTAGGLRSDDILTIHRDREGVVWFGTDRGVCRYDRTSFRTSQVSENGQSNFVRTLLRTKAGETWAGTNRGLFKLTGEAWTEAAELQGRSIYTLTEDAAGAVWAGTDGGLYARSKGSGFARIASGPATAITIENDPETQPPGPAPEPPTTPPADPETPPQTTRESVRAATIFRDRLYAAFFGRGIERVEGDRRIPALADSFARQAVCLAAEGDTALWIGTADGELWRYDGTNARRFAVPQSQPGEKAIRAIAFDEGRMWIGAAQGLFTRERDEIREARAGLNLYGVLAGGGTLWLASQNSGLIKFRPAEDLSIRFDTEQGLASQQVFALAADEGDLLIGTSRGVTRHRPGRTAPRIAVRRLVADKIYLPEYLTAELPLDHPQRSFLLEVTGLGSRTYPSQFQYEYVVTTNRGKPVGQVTKADPQFAAESLEPGAYRVTVRAISRDLVYSEPLTLRLRVHAAPFPRTTVLLASLLAVAIGAAVWAFRQQRRLARANQELETTNAELHETRLRLANETEAERSRIARDLHDQTLADLRNLLVMTDQLPAEPAGDEAAPSPALLRREIESISSEIRHICEDLSPSVLENIGFLPALEWALADAVAHLPAERKFAYDFACDPDLEERLQLTPIEQIQLYRIVQEALNNICRHAAARNVAMTVRPAGPDLHIAITDDGIGFDGAQLNKTGHGLANIRSRANLIGARVEWRDAAPGCRFEAWKEGAIR